MQLYFFDPVEFGVWWPAMDPRLLVLLDVFRFQWGAPVTVSGHPRALGRTDGAAGTSDHNVDRHGCVLAADVFPGGMINPGAAWRALAIARDVGFTSLGVYPHWSRPGLHLGTRRTARPGEPATWGAVRGHGGAQVYVSVQEALWAWHAGDVEDG